MTSGVGRPSQTGARSRIPADWAQPPPWSGSYWSRCWLETPGRSLPPAGPGRPPSSQMTPVGTCPLSVGRSQNRYQGSYYTDTDNMASSTPYHSTNTVHALDVIIYSHVVIWVVQFFTLLPEMGVWISIELIVEISWLTCGDVVTERNVSISLTKFSNRDTSWKITRYILVHRSSFYKINVTVKICMH